MDYKTVFKRESFGSYSFGIHIELATSLDLDNLKYQGIHNAIRRAEEMISREIQLAIKINNPKTKKETEENKELIKLFPQPIYVEEIPNQYCNDWCCQHLPWFIVTTTIGRIKIGWRKRVINIDWSDTKCKIDGADLFPDEDTTIGNNYIHAWSLEKAKQYIKIIINSCKAE